MNEAEKEKLRASLMRLVGVSEVEIDDAESGKIRVGVVGGYRHEIANHLIARPQYRLFSGEHEFHILHRTVSFSHVYGASDA